MATESVKVVDPDMGSGYNYDSLYDWEAGEQKNLVTADEIAVAKCRCTGGTADTTKTHLSGWTTSTSCYIKIWTDPSESYRHSGTYPSGNKYRLEVTVNNEFLLETSGTNHVRIDGIAIKLNMTDSCVYGVGVGNASSNYLLNGAIRISNCIIKKTGGSSSYSSGIEISLATSSAVVRLWNNIVYDFSGNTASNHRGIRVDNGYDSPYLYVYNCTVVDCGTGYSNGPGSSVNYYATNCGASGCSTGFTSYITQTTCSSSTPTFSDSGSDNFHLASEDTTWKDQGTSDPGSGLFSDDIDGQTRSGSWDIGADEYVAGGGIAIPVFMHNRMQQ